MVILADDFRKDAQPQPAEWKTAWLLTSYTNTLDPRDHMHEEFRDRRDHSGKPRSAALGRGWPEYPASLAWVVAFLPLATGVWGPMRRLLWAIGPTMLFATVGLKQ